MNSDSHLICFLLTVLTALHWHDHIHTLRHKLNGSMSPYIKEIPCIIIRLYNCVHPTRKAASVYHVLRNLKGAYSLQLIQVLDSFYYNLA